MPVGVWPEAKLGSNTAEETPIRAFDDKDMHWELILPEQDGGGSVHAVAGVYPVLAGRGSMVVQGGWAGVAINAGDLVETLET